MRRDFGRLHALVTVVVATVVAAACVGTPAAPVSATAAPPASSASPMLVTPASATAQSASAGPSTDPALVGSWARTQSCEDQLAAFAAGGFLTTPAEAYDWITANWVPGNPPPTPKGDAYCAGASPAREHSHFFTANGQFGSRDENGNQVDEGDYRMKEAGVLTFPSHASEFEYAGEITVGYKIDGDTLTFDVRLPRYCLKAADCAKAYGWALSAFFGPAPWHRST